MKEWLLSVVAVIVLTVLLELMMSEGELKKYTQGFVRLCLVFVIVFPALKIFKGDINVNFEENIPGIDDPIVDESFLERTRLARIRNAERLITGELENNGVYGVKIRINTSYDRAGKIKIDNVEADLRSAVITDGTGNILITDKVINAVKKYIDATKEMIIIYGGEYPEAEVKGLLIQDKIDKTHRNYNCDCGSGGNDIDFYRLAEKQRREEYRRQNHRGTDRGYGNRTMGEKTCQDLIRH